MFDENDIKELLNQYPTVDIAFAYGSGVLKQTGYNDEEDSSKMPMIDLVFAVKNVEEWHNQNMKMNPTHYTYDIPLSIKNITYIQENIGAGMWYNTYLPINISKYPDRMIKYGIISMDMLLADLNEWDNGLYIAGRLHKPILLIKGINNIEFQQALYRNFEHAINIALLMLPPTFTDFELYRKIASLSYMGDIRMHIAENPNKINNLVTPQLTEYRKLYKSSLQHYINDDTTTSNNNNSTDIDTDTTTNITSNTSATATTASTMINHAIHSLDASRVQLVGETMNKIRLVKADRMDGSDGTDEDYITYTQINGSSSTRQSYDSILCIRYNMLCNLPLAIRRRLYTKPPHFPLSNPPGKPTKCSISTPYPDPDPNHVDNRISMGLKLDSPCDRKNVLRKLFYPSQKMLQSAVAKTVARYVDV